VFPRGGTSLRRDDLEVPLWHAPLLKIVVTHGQFGEFSELSNQRAPAVRCPGESYFVVGYVSYREIGNIRPVVEAGGRFREDADAA
jgi:hypothetical protein